ncbi:putative lysine-specific demethylase JMJ16 [Malania oleifera]|uniref:putative lysine-specific demethylase JMJ16 n=1 Tax=Malania oleifera TaxID=397392 RepID=UPI0025ADD90D|nr:putative lysine-specific demethylase JMJ16 [Malania oleifera]XP_057961154.1 putative lysine-specific demethylase JMJ16 [Malania oleifera]XP_057961155.1 putative lysine-specific demethylase JMJ16 [Malania oleifera]XP_057961156.1 putative lysine-specific demethylase JMJ16 [Malania oleifera]XP_057961157.1 putative lysine-specific demethylase JMJ16 [Malania oleifera]
MGMEPVGACPKEEDIEIPAVPPGFESLAPFYLKRVDDSKDMISCSASTSASESQSVHMENERDINDAAKVTRSLRRRPWINYSRFDNSSDDESEIQKPAQNLPSMPRLPKGVIRGCSDCSDCQKVMAKWRPEDGCKPDLEEAPVFYPSEEEFKDTLKYIASIRPRAEEYGICRIVPPPSWKPPCPLTEKHIWESSKFATRVQRIDKLQNRNSMRKLSKMYNHVRRKRRRCTRMGADRGTASESISVPGDSGLYEAERFGFEPGPELTLDAFQKYADDFKSQYFSKNKSAADLEGNVTTQWEPSVENIEGEYWRMVEKPTDEIEVLYGADLETGVFGSGFPTMSNQVTSASDDQYIKSGWNLNNFPRLPGSVLSYESGDISGVLVPWLYIGMCFSSFCWHVEDHHLYSLNYMHWGAPKMWYGVPGRDALKLEEAMRKHLPDLFEEQPDLLHKLVTQLSPSILKSEGVPVHRCVQNRGEFVLTFPRAYHSGFNCGFNCAEAVNVAPVDWLPHGQNAIELYREQGRKTSISHDKLLLGAAREAVRAHWELHLLKKDTLDNLRWKDVCGKDGILAKSLKARVEMERVSREFLCNSSHAEKMKSNFDATNERECSLCFFDLHLSAAGCQCSPERFACLHHAKQFCSCSQNTRFFLFRYDINELNILVEALEGKLSAIYRWARLDLGLALSSSISRDNFQVPGFLGKLSHSQTGAVSEKMTSESIIASFKELKGEENTRETIINPPGTVGVASQLKGNPAEAVLEEGKASSMFSVPSNDTDAANHSSRLKNDSFESLPSNSLFCKLSQEDTSYYDNLAAEEAELKNHAGLRRANVIYLSDDEGEEIKKPVLDRANKTSSARHLEPSERLVTSDCQASLCNHDKEQALTTPMTNAMVMGEGDVNLLPDVEKNAVSCHVGSTGAGFEKNRGTDNDMTRVSSYPMHTQPCGSGNFYGENKVERMGLNASSKSVDDVQTVSGSPSCSQNNLDRYFRQKGPRIAKVVRRINRNVEPLEFGVVCPGKLWCSSRAIFPKGFRSRVRYISILDPTTMCNYLSEILDAGKDGPLFMVSLEECPSEVFIHVSASKCWEMVIDRVNQEITKQHKLGRMKLHPLQPPGSLDGLEMFGFSSPAIMQIIESMDRNRVCAEYWKSRPQMQSPQHSQSKDSSESFFLNSKELTDKEACGNQSLAIGVDMILRGLFKKANSEELRSLCSILSGNNATADQGLVTRLLNEEIDKHPR